MDTSDVEAEDEVNALGAQASQIGAAVGRRASVARARDAREMARAATCPREAAPPPRRLQTNLDEISLGEIADEDAREAARRARKAVQAALEEQLVPALASLRAAIRDARVAASG